ncbi:hypothetical protein SUDANB176_06636 [Streptomyces sp. enrichment culture]
MFVVSRIREVALTGASAKDAVRRAVSGTGRAGQRPPFPAPGSRTSTRPRSAIGGKRVGGVGRRLVVRAQERGRSQ